MGTKVNPNAFERIIKMFETAHMDKRVFSPATLYNEGWILRIILHILQEGFVKVFRKIDQVRNPAAFPGWIRRLMINTALEKYRSQVLLQRLDQVHGDPGDEGEDEVFDNLTCEELVALIQSLTPRYRMVFNLYAIEGYSHQEISEELGISVGTSKSNLSRARAILQEKIKQRYGTLIAR